MNTYTKTFTPAAWFEFQMDDRMVEALEFERISAPDEDVEFKVTFVWKES